MTARELYAQAKRRLNEAGIDAVVEPRTLFEIATGTKYTEYRGDEPMPQHASEKLDELVDRRIKGEPLQYIAGKWPFLDFEVSVGKGVLIPRPETELVALAAIELIKDIDRPAVLDLCSGTGCIAIAIKRAMAGSDVTATELYHDAFGFLTKNIAELAAGINAASADVLGYEKTLGDNSFDLIAANPPYVTPAEYRDNFDELRYEPKEAFIGGRDGLDFYRYIIENYKAKLKPGGSMLFETGFNQTEAVERIFIDTGYKNVSARCDDFGLPRMVYAEK